MDLLTPKNGGIHSPESPQGPIWKPDLYRLQEEAPKPRGVVCQDRGVERPEHYGAEYHGLTSGAEAAALLRSDGDYLVRLSGPPHHPTTTLSFQFGGKVKHYRVYYDGQHYVGNKRFDCVRELVADGLVTLHLEAEAGPYIQLMSDVAKYEKSPAYMTLNRLKQRQRKPQLKEAEEEVSYDKPHAFKTHNFKGLNWCEFCSNFLWGFTAQGVKCEDCGLSAHFKCSEKVPADCWPQMKEVRSVFGVDLTTLVRAHRSVRPFVVDKCVAEIEARGLRTEGLYRVSGFADEMDSLRMALDKDGRSADMSSAVYDNINVVAGILKLYFRLLPIPLITYEVHPTLIRAVQLPTLREQLKGARDALSLLPPAHYNTLKFLMAHLHRVEENQTSNKMSAQNLGTVFAPTLLPTPTSKYVGAIPDMSGEINALCLIIQHHSIVFE